MKKLLILFFVLILNAALTHAVPIFGGLSDVVGYKNVKFGMNKETVNERLSKSLNTTKHEIHAVFMESIVIREDTECIKYYDEQSKLVYLFFFYKDSLYRIDVATHTGVRYDELDVNNYVALSRIDDLVRTLTAKHGRYSKVDREHYSYKGSDFDITTYWWTSEMSSVSLVVRPVIDMLKKEYKFYTYRLTYYDDIALYKMKDIILK